MRMLFFLLLALATWAELPGPAERLRLQAQERSRWWSDASALRPDFVPTQDGQSFFAVWKTVPQPRYWIVSLHGSNGYASDDLAVWAPHLSDRQVGLICLQWWLGRDDLYLPPARISQEVSAVLRTLKVPPGRVLLHAFSRGSANSYALAALDTRRYFGLIVASSGGFNPDYPPNQLLSRGRPLQGTRWITVAGAADPHPERDGLPAMRRTADWLREQGAEVLLTIEDPRGGHGAFHRNADNARKVLDRFEQLL